MHDATTDRVSVVAIHGVGNHPAGTVAELIRCSLPDEPSQAGWDVEEFNWDQFVREVPGADYGASGWALRTVSADGQNAARLAVSYVDGGVDAGLARWQLKLCELLRVTTAVIFSILFAIPLLIVTVGLLGWATEASLPGPSEVIRLTATVAPFAFSIVAGLLVLQGILGALRAVATRSLARIRGTLASMALSAMTPFLVALSVPVVVQWMESWAFVLIFSVAFVAMSGLALALQYVFHAGDVDPATVAQLLRYVGPMWAALLLGQAVHLLFSRGWIGGPIKVVVDILRYLGETNYRTAVLRRFGETMTAVKRKSGGRPIVVIAHSLGSIIALDWLANGDGLGGDERIDLVTMGSPYRRIRRFLPGVLFALDPDQTTASVSARLERFRWLNVYRPLDYVGTKLGLKAGVGLDRSTSEWTKLDGHGNYWGDARVLNVIRTSLSTLSACQRTSAPPSWKVLASAADPETDDPDSLPGDVFKLYIVAVCVILVASMALREPRLSAERGLLEQTGEAVDVTVTHQRFIVDDDGTEMHQFTLERPDGTRLPAVSIFPSGLLAEVNRRLDYRALLVAVRADCRLQGEKPSLGSSLAVSCRSNHPLRVIVSRTDPTRFLFPCCPPRFYWREFPGLVLQIGISGLFTSMVFSPFLAIWTVVLAVLLGRPGPWDFTLE